MRHILFLASCLLWALPAAAGFSHQGTGGDARPLTLAQAGPASPTSFSQQQRVRELETQIQQLQQQLATRPVAATAPVPAATALETRMAELERLMRELTGRMEQQQFAAAQQQARLDRLIADMELRFSQLEGKQALAAVAPPAVPMPPSGGPTPLTGEPARNPAAPPLAAPTGLPAAIPTPSRSGELGGLTYRDGQLVQEAAIKNPNPPTGAPDTARKLYDKAFASLRQADYPDAEAGFKQYLVSFPDGDLTDNARYWLAETYYVRGQYEQSAAAFGEAFQKNPEGSKAADSLLKLGMSLGALGKKDDACVTLGEITKRFPNAAATVRQRATQERTRLGCA